MLYRFIGIIVLCNALYGASFAQTPLQKLGSAEDQRRGLLFREPPGEVGFIAASEAGVVALYDATFVQTKSLDVSGLGPEGFVFQNLGFSTNFTSDGLGVPRIMAYYNTVPRTGGDAARLFDIDGTLIAETGTDAGSIRPLEVSAGGRYFVVEVFGERYPRSTVYSEEAPRTPIRSVQGRYRVHDIGNGLDNVLVEYFLDADVQEIRVLKAGVYGGMITSGSTVLWAKSAWGRSISSIGAPWAVMTSSTGPIEARVFDGGGRQVIQVSGLHDGDVIELPVHGGTYSVELRDVAGAVAIVRVVGL